MASFELRASLQSFYTCIFIDLECNKLVAKTLNKTYLNVTPISINKLKASYR